MRCDSGFFSPGGTLPPSAPSYVARRADREIVEALVRGEFVFVLESRQKGKSSLIVHSLDRLHKQGVLTLRVDLQRFGTNLTPEQWYGGLLHSIANDLGTISAARAYWQDHRELGPCLRFFSAVEELVLPSVDRPIVIFIDEVDFVRALPFSADELFASIRECYNRRATQPEFTRLTFCLVGVASPSQLIRNEDVTPFNIGTRIELNDFVRAEMQPFAAEISKDGRNGARLLGRVFDWVSGHPYLTQLLAAWIAAEPTVCRPSDVDRLVKRRLLGSEGREHEPNLADTERRLLEASLPGATAEESRSQVLDAYRLLLANRFLPANHPESVVSTLLLSGVAIERQGRLQPRNPLYRRLFDEAWRKNNSPDAELRRQQAASARAAWRVVWVGLSLFAVTISGIIWLLLVTQARDRALAESRRLAKENIAIAYRSSMALASERLSEGDYLDAYSLVEGQRDSPERGWEWSFLHSRLFTGTTLTPPPHPGNNVGHLVRAWREGGHLVSLEDREIRADGVLLARLDVPSNAASLTEWLLASRGAAPLPDRIRMALPIFQPPLGDRTALSIDGQLLARGALDTNSVEIEDQRNHSRISLKTPFVVNRLQFSPDARWLQIVDRYNKGYCLELATGRRVDGVGRFSPDSSCIVASQIDPVVTVVRLSDDKPVCRLVGHTAPMTGSDWFRDGKRLVTCSDDGTARLWSIPDGKLLRVFSGGDAGYSAVSLGPSERRLLAATMDGEILEWRTDLPENPATLSFHHRNAVAILLTPDGKHGITGSQDGTSVLFDLESGKEIARYAVGFKTQANPMVISRDGTFCAVADVNGAVWMIDPQTGRILWRTKDSKRHVTSLAFAPDDRLIAATAEGAMMSFDPLDASLRAICSVKDVLKRIVVAPDGNSIVACDGSGRVRLFDARTFQPIRTLLAIRSQITNVEFSPDGNRVSAAAMDLKGYLLDPQGKSPPVELIGHAARLWEARFSPDGKSVLTTSYDGTARVWRVADGVQCARLQHGSWVASAEWSPDGSRVGTTCADQSVRFFDPKTGAELIRMRGNGGYVLDGKFTSDGTTYVTANADGTVQIWRTELSNPIE